jgi:hypothetical protein
MREVQYTTTSQLNFEAFWNAEFNSIETPKAQLNIYISTTLAESTAELFLRFQTCLLDTRYLNIGLSAAAVKKLREFQVLKAARHANMSTLRVSVPDTHSKNSLASKSEDFENLADRQLHLCEREYFVHS